MPHEGQSTVTIPKYVWEKVANYFKEHEKELRRKGIKSASKLVQVWIEEKISER